MRIDNTQANIFKVNGGIADNFANRPAAQSSFYIFYSIDTQEIYYDNGTWVLIGSGGGGGVNIYNSDGTLTGNRTLSGANNDLNFADLNIFKTSVGGNDIGLKLDFANNLYYLGDFLGNNNLTRIVADDSGKMINLYATQDLIFTVDGDNKISFFEYFGGYQGIFFSFINSIYEFGQLTGGNQSIFKIDDTTQFVNIQKSGIDGGIEVNLSNNWVRLGDWFSLYGGHKIDITPTDITMTAGGLNTPSFRINSQLDFIATYFQSNIIGLNLDFATSIYQFGQITGGNQTYLTIDDAAAYPVQLDGTNITSGTSGGVSGQHLKIKLNGVDYKIELRNP